MVPLSVVALLGSPDVGVVGEILPFAEQALLPEELLGEGELGLVVQLGEVGSELEAVGLGGLHVVDDLVGL